MAFLQQAWHGHTQKPVATELPLPSGSPSPLPAHPPIEAQIFQKWKLLRNTTTMFSQAL